MKKIMTGGLFVLAAVSQAGTMTWNFDDNLASMEDGSLLGQNGSAASGAYEFVDDVINGQTARVLKLTRNQVDNAANPWLNMSNPFVPNGGGTMLNQYSIVMDVKVSSDGDRYNSFMQTDLTNTSDGDAFWDSSTSVDRGGIGISGDYSDAGNPLRFSGDVWHRVVLTMDLTQPAGNSSGWQAFVDGALQNVVQSPSGYGVDGRYAIGSALLLFADDDNEMKNMNFINNLQFVDRALSANEVADLGGPTAGAVPEPASMGLLALGAAALLRRRKA